MSWEVREPDQKLAENKSVGRLRRFSFKSEPTGNIAVNPGYDLVHFALDLIVRHPLFLRTFPAYFFSVHSSSLCMSLPRLALCAQHDQLPTVLPFVCLVHEDALRMLN